MGPFHNVIRQGRRGLVRMVSQQQQRGFSGMLPPSHQLVLVPAVENRQLMVAAGTKLRWAVPLPYTIPAASYRLLHLCSQASSQRNSILCSFSSSASPDLGGKGGGNDPSSNPYEIKVEGRLDHDSPTSGATAAGTTPASGATTPATKMATQATGLAAHSEGPPTPPARVPTAMADLNEEQKEERIRELETELEKADLLLLKKDNVIRDLERTIVRMVVDAQDLIDRVRREAEAAKKFALECFAKDLAEVADNFDRALASVPEQFRHPDRLEDPRGYLTVMKTLLEGVEMTKQQLEKVFDEHGLKKFVPLNEPFDPNFHEAVYVINDPSKPTGLIVDVAKPGYVLHDRVIRPAQVGVVRLPVK